MRNIIKALNYQTKSDIVTYCTLLPVAFLLATAFMDLDMEKTTGSYFISYAGENFALVPIFCILMLGVRILGWDYSDKTMNYEILSGHHRREVYFARVIVAHIWSILFCLTFMVLPVIFFTALNGWGITMDLKGAAIRFVLAIFPMIRLVCQYVLFVFIVKNSYVAWALGYLLSMFSMIIPMLLEELTKKFRLTYHLAETNLMELFTFNQRIGYVNGEDVTVCQTELEPSFVTGTIIVSLAVSAVCIISGYIIFKKSDVN
ncbi:MAG: ABC transporter permease subunit [Oscillospiraceae bacterium]|nr:ABC transporter permease subunit [Oscillospiraceae bacterium]